MLASYTYSRSIDDQSNGQTTTSQVPQPSNLSTQYAPSDFQATHVLNLGWVWLLPQLNHGSRLLKETVNGWRFGGIYNARTGNPLNIHLAGDSNLNDERPQRPSLAPGANPNLPSGRHRADKVVEWFNTTSCTPETLSATPGCVWIVPDTGTFGNVGRNSLYGPAYILTNFSLGRFFTLPGE